MLQVPTRQTQDDAMAAIARRNAPPGNRAGTSRLERTGMHDEGGTPILHHQRLTAAQADGASTTELVDDDDEDEAEEADRTEERVPEGRLPPSEEDASPQNGGGAAPLGTAESDTTMPPRSGMKCSTTGPGGTGGRW